jgi:sugar/nucleoside kinase (ribokinase family)
MRDMDHASPRIVSVGECTTDDYSQLGQEFVGGISLNFAVHCRREGCAVSLVSCIGNDYSDQILNKLSSEGVDSSHIRIESGSTARQKIIVRTDGERIFPPAGYDAGVLADYRMNAADISFMQSHDILRSALFRQVQPLFQQTMEIPFEGWRVADFLDLADYDHDLSVIEQLSKKLKIAFLSGDRTLAHELQILSRSTDCLIVLTSGAEGSVAFLQGECASEPAVPVAKPIDSTGCGDAFQAGFTFSYYRQRDLRRALQRGAQLASRVLQHYGGTD